MTKENRVEKHHITKSHPMFKICSQYTHLSKNLYNHANYIIRQHYFKTGEFLNYHKMRVIMKVEDSFKAIGSNAGQMTLKLLEQNWKSFLALKKEWSKNPHRLLGKPNPPRYLDKEKGRYVVTLTNMQSQIKDEYLYFTFKPFKPFNDLIKVRSKDKHCETRITPKNGYYLLEVVFQKSVESERELSNRIIGIDIGLNNLCTIQNTFGESPVIINGKPIKSANSYYNSKKSKIQSELMKVNKSNWSNKLSQLTMKRNNKISHYLHKSTKFIKDYCELHNVDTVVIGNNKLWKQDFKKRKNFTQLPFEILISQLQYKLREIGIRVIITEESYTSKASFVDGDKMEKSVEFSGKRLKRGLYQTKEGRLINADVNGVSNIIRKVFSDFKYEIKGVHFHPLVITM